MTIEQVKDIFDVFSTRVRDENYCNEYTFDVAYYAHEILKCKERLETETEDWKKVVYKQRINTAMKNLERLLR